MAPDHIEAQAADWRWFRHSLARAINDLADRIDGARESSWNDPAQTCLQFGEGLSDQALIRPVGQQVAAPVLYALNA